MASTQTSSEVLLEKQNATKPIENKFPEKVTLTSDSKTSTATIYTQGATLTSWITNDIENIYCSKLAIFDKEKKAIRGGIPLVFPNFGPWELGPQHGFGRNQKWSLVGQSDRSAKFELCDNEYSRGMWNHHFKLIYNVKVTDKNLITTLSVENKNEKDEFDFTTLLHTYFQIPDITNLSITGLENAMFKNSLKPDSNLTKQDGPIKNINQNIDQNYFKTNDTHELNFKINEKPRKITIRKTNLPDTVVWNPWSEKAKAMSDFGDEDYKFMVCVEAGYIGERKVLKAGEVFQCEQVLSVE